MRLLSKIQSKVRVYARDSNLTITDNANAKIQGLETANQVYRKLSNIYKWPEFLRTDVSISTVSGTESYNWPSSPTFSDIINVEMLNSDGVYEIIPITKDELEWSYFSRKTNAFPSIYRLESSGSQKQISFAPIPNIAKTIKIRGIIEPSDFINGDSQTVFDSGLIDDVLEYLISAEVLFKRNQTEWAILLVRKSSSILTNYTGKEINPSELDPRVGEVTQNAN